MNETAFYKRWSGMIARCNNKKLKQYKDYGGRGIKVCKRWEKFENFRDDMLSTYKKELQLDRVNNDGDYKPSNCRWVTRLENSLNRRDSVIYKGENASTASMRLVGHPRLVSSRIRKGWSLKRAFTTPFQEWYSHKQT